MRTTPDEHVRRWAQDLAPATVYTTAVTVAEVRFGIARLPAGRRRTLLSTAAEDTFEGFADHILPFEAATAVYYADIVIEREHAGTPISGFDAQIAAICRSQRAILATRNTDDFSGIGLELINPWLVAI